MSTTTSAETPGAREAREAAAADPSFRSYHGRPVVKEPEWTWEVPWYLFTGGLAGASSALAWGARLAGSDTLADRAQLVAAVGAAASPVLLIQDLGRPGRFHHMLRVFKPTSAMSVGSWLLATFGPAAAGAAALGVLGRLPRLRRALEGMAGLLGPPVATYTAVLMSDSSIPVWHEARGDLPFAFAGSAAASAGAAATLVTPPEQAGPARRLAVLGALAELGATRAMEDRLGETGEVYDEGDAGAWGKAAKVATAAGGVLLALGVRRGKATAAGAVLTLAGSVCQRWSVYRAGFQSAWNPKYTVKPQRERLDRGQGHR